MSSCGTDFHSCFFFKQKTAYEMRISDWSSDVCSSDLAATVQLSLAGASLVFVDGRCHKAGGSVTAQLAGVLESPLQLEGTVSCDGARGRLALQALEPASLPVEADLVIRSEEHTSELQSLMRNSYAVFCLKQKKNTHQKH